MAGKNALLLIFVLMLLLSVTSPTKAWVRMRPKKSTVAMRRSRGNIYTREAAYKGARYEDDPDAFARAGQEY